MFGKAKILLVWGQRNIESMACMDNSIILEHELRSWQYLFLEVLSFGGFLLLWRACSYRQHLQHQSSLTMKVCCWIFKPPWPHLATQKSAQLPPLTWRFTMAGFTGVTQPSKEMGSMWLFGFAKACCTFMSKYVQQFPLRTLINSVAVGSGQPFFSLWSQSLNRSEDIILARHARHIPIHVKQSVSWASSLPERLPARKPCPPAHFPGMRPNLSPCKIQNILLSNILIYKKKVYTYNYNPYVCHTCMLLWIFNNFLLHIYIY